MGIKDSDSYLESLVGKEVQVNKGGPESKRGVIKDVKPDYFLLFCNDNRLIWFQTKHIKSLIKNSKTNLSQSTEDAVELDMPAHFANMLDTLVSETVQVNQGGPESKVGKLLSVKQDFFVLLTKEDGIVCYQIDHVKSISLVQGEESEEENQQENHTENVETDPNLLTEENIENIEKLDEYYADINILDELFTQMNYSLVSINRGGPEKIVGVLVDSSDDFLTIVVNEDVIRTSKFHLKSISQIINKENNKDSSKNEKKQSTEEKKEDQSDKEDGINVSKENNNTTNGKEKKNTSKEIKKEGNQKEDKKNNKEKEDKKNKKDDKEKENKENKKEDKEKSLKEKGKKKEQ